MHSRLAPRRRHSDALKSKVLVACDVPGTSVAAVAQANGLNANLVHKWRRSRGAKPASLASASSSKAAGVAEFIALPLPGVMPPASPPSVVADIRVQLKRGATTVVVCWPISAAADCAAWLREWLR